MTAFDVKPTTSGYLDLDVPVGTTSLRITECPKGKLKPGCIPSTVTHLGFDNTVTASHFEPGVIGESVTHLSFLHPGLPPIPSTIKHLFHGDCSVLEVSPAPDANVYVHLSNGDSKQPWIEEAGIYWNGSSLPWHAFDHTKYTYGPEQKATFGTTKTICFVTRALKAKLKIEPVVTDPAPIITDTQLDELFKASISTDAQTVAGWILEALTTASTNGTLHEGFQFSRLLPKDMNITVIKANIQRCIKTNRLVVTVVDGADGTHSIEAKLNA